MDRIYLFPNGNWCWVDMFDWQGGSPKDAVEIIIGSNWSDRDVSQMITEYYNENSETLFEDKS